MATALRGAWRQTPAPPARLAEDLSAITPLLLSFGAGALGWWQVRHSDLRESAPALQLQQAYRLHSLQAAIHQRSIGAIVPYLESAGIDPVLVKGWAISRLYPEQGLRPYGDIDLCVKREQYSAAESALRDPNRPQCSLDLHDGFAKLDELRDHELYERSVPVDMAGGKVRVLAAEDHLRVLCVHLLRHGVCRPLWLCDIGAALESIPPDFDWNRCLTSDRRVADWVACAVGLAHQLLDARLGDAPVASRAKRLPKWLARSVLKQWATPFKPRVPIASLVSRPTALIPEIRRHWPNGIEATIGVRGSFTELPRLPYEIGHCLSRAFMLWAESRIEAGAVDMDALENAPSRCVKRPSGLL